MLAGCFTKIRDYFYAAAPLRVCAFFRVAYASLLLIDIALWCPDLYFWFSTAGVGSYRLATALNHGGTLSIFSLLPNTPLLVSLCYVIFVMQAIALLCGFYTRIQAVCVYIWLLSFYSLNALIWDGEDIVFAMLGFFLIFLPSNYYWAFDAKKLAVDQKNPSSVPTIWPLRLIQIEMCLIYLSTALAKAQGTTWWDGTAMYYVVRMHDLYGRLPIPAFIAENIAILQVMTWIVLIVELALPFLLICTPTRRIGLILAVGLHLSIEVSMNLFLFQWIMLCGLISFLSDAQLSPKKTITR